MGRLLAPFERVVGRNWGISSAAINCKGPGAFSVLPSASRGSSLISHNAYYVIQARDGGRTDPGVLVRKRHESKSLICPMYMPAQAASAVSPTVGQ